MVDDGKKEFGKYLAIGGLGLGLGVSSLRHQYTHAIPTDNKKLAANTSLKLYPISTTMESSNATATLSKYVTLISNDGFEFVVLREAACISGAIRRMLDPKSELPLSYPTICKISLTPEYRQLHGGWQRRVQFPGDQVGGIMASKCMLA